MIRNALFQGLCAVFFLWIFAVSRCERGGSMGGGAVYPIAVPAMVCAGCAAALESALEPVNGVEEVRVDVAAKQVAVGVDASVIGDDAVLRKAIEGAGYQAGVETDKGAAE